ncbi:hypothetical protein [Povalibacter sp.]|uniref:hypothetical protein n=1 Tax=Povalibacter sp. TaxID=1962978 RepID=UPI002F3E6F4D
MGATAQQHLDFAFLDDLARAAARKRLDPVPYIDSAIITRLGPALELLTLLRGNAFPGGRINGEIGAALRTALEQKPGRRAAYINTADEYAGFITAARNPGDDERLEWIAFCLEARKAAGRSLPDSVARGMVGAMREMENNVYEHSGRHEDAVVAFRGTSEDFEFVVADSGIGILNSLHQSPDYQHLRDPGTAIKMALSDGQSRCRYIDPARGLGFHDLFVGLANLNGELRFRSDDHALTIDGASPSLMKAQLSQKVQLQGFVASVVCRLRPTSTAH